MNTSTKMLLALLVGLLAGVIIARSLFMHPQPPAEDPFEVLEKKISEYNFTVLRPAGKYTAEQDSFQRKMIHLLHKAGSGPVAAEYIDAPSRPVSPEEVKDLIDRYKENPLKLFTHVGDKLDHLRGWFIERDSLLAVFARNPEANGVQLMLGRKDGGNYDPFTVIWMPRYRDPNVDYLEEWITDNGDREIFRPASTDTVWWKDAHDYLRPCPPDCPRK